MIPFLEASLLRPVGLVVAAWLVLRIFRVQHPASRHSVWTAVLVGMLLLPIISVVSPRLTLPILPAPQRAESQILAPPTPAAEPVIDVTPAELPAAVDEQSENGSPSFVWPSTETMIVGVYLAGFSLLAIYRLLGWALLRRVLLRSRSTRPSCLRESTDVVTPVAVGVLRPSVILPAGWRTWNVRTRRAVLAHEFAHLRRRDTVIAALGRFTTSVFWFHPVAWWVARKTSDLAELACDAVALERVGDPAGYSRVLVEFAYAVHRSGRRVALPGLAMASGSRINDRVDQVFEISKGTMRKLGRPRVLLVAVGLPVMSLVCTLALGARGAQQTASPTVKFDIVSIKPCPGLDVVRPPGSGRGANPTAPQISPGFVHWDCATLAELVDQTYASGAVPLLNTLNRARDDSPKRVRGGPSWIGSDRFTIEVKVSGDVTELTGSARFIQMRDAMLPALRAMIEDRFQLKLHRATEERPMYALTVVKGGLNKDRVTKIAAGDCWVRDASTNRTTAPPGLSSQQMCGNVRGGLNKGNRTFEYGGGDTMAGFAQELSNIMDRYVLDKTGLDGQFKFAFEYAPDDSTPGNRTQTDRILRDWAAEGVPQAEVQRLLHPDGQTIFKAIEQLGLKLEPTKGPAEYLVIDSVQRPRPNVPATGS